MEQIQTSMDKGYMLLVTLSVLNTTLKLSSMKTNIMLMNSANQESEQSTEGSFISIPLNGS